MRDATCTWRLYPFSTGHSHDKPQLGSLSRASCHISWRHSRCFTPVGFMHGILPGQPEASFHPSPPIYSLNPYASDWKPHFLTVDIWGQKNFMLWLSYQNVFLMSLVLHGWPASLKKNLCIDVPFLSTYGCWFQSWAWQLFFTSQAHLPTAHTKKKIRSSLGLA